MERILDDPEFNYKHGYKTYCHSCKHCHKNDKIFEIERLKGMVNGKRKTVRVKYGEMYCISDGGDFQENVRSTFTPIRAWAAVCECVPLKQCAADV